MMIQSPGIQAATKRKASLRVSNAPVVDDRFQRKDKPEGQEVSIARGDQGDLILLHRLSLDPGSSPEVRQVLLRAAESTTFFRNANVLPVRGVRLEGDALVFVQEYPHGPLLADAMTPGHPLPLPEALKWMRQFAHSLEAVEADGLTLSQICPTEFVVSDAFGERHLICLCPPVPAGWWLEVEDPVFASPEQKKGQPCDIRSALYSAGAVLAVMVTGHRAQDEAGWNKILAGAALPKSVEKALRSALEPVHGKRCATPAEWMALLNKAIAATAPPTTTAAASPEKRTAKPVPVPVAAQQTRIVSVKTTPVPNVELLRSSTLFIQAGKPQKKPWLAITAIASAMAMFAWVLWPPAKQPTQGEETIPKSSSVAAQSPPEKPEPQTAVTGVAVEPKAPPVPAPLPAPAEPAVNAAPPKPPVVSTVETPPASLPERQPTAPPVAMKESEVETAPLVAPLPAPSAPAKQPTKAVDPTPKVKPVPAATDLLQQATAATGAERASLFHQVLAKDPRNLQALRGLVERTLKDIPPEGEKLEELKDWAGELVAQEDPLGSHALGCITLQQSGQAGDLTAITKELSKAVVLLKRSLAEQHADSYFFLVQAYINLHNVRVQNGAGPEAEQTRRALLNEIANAPKEVPASDSRSLAERLDGLLKDRAAKGTPHPQQAFLKTVADKLYAKAADGGDAAAKEWLKARQ